MANRPKREPNTTKYNGREYLTYDEAADYIGVRRSTIFTMITKLEIEPHKFKLDKKRYLALADVQRMYEVRDKPWLAGPDEEKQPKASKEAA